MIGCGSWSAVQEAANTLNEMEAMRLLEIIRGAPTNPVAALAGVPRDEVVTAVEWFRDHGKIDEALDLAARLQPWWLVSGENRTGRVILAQLLSMPGATGATARLRGLWAAGELAFRDPEPGSNDAARAYYEEALDAAQAAGDWDAELRALVGLARTALRDGDFARVRDLGERGQRIAREHGHRDAEWLPQHMQAASARMLDDRPRAWQLYQASLELANEAGRPDRAAGEKHNMGYLALRDGDVEQAKSLFRAAAEEGRRLGDRYLLPYLVLDLAAVATAEGRFADGASLLGAATAQLDADEVILDPDDAAEYRSMTERLRVELGDAFEQWLAEGRRRSIDDALDEAYGAIA